MYQLYGFPTQNTKKVIYTAQALKLELDFSLVDLRKAEQKIEDFSKLTPVGKVPLLKHDDYILFESGAICRYLANITESPLYPQNDHRRGFVDQWMDFFSCHLGRWLSGLYYQKILKPKFGLGAPNPVKIEECSKFLQSDFQTLNRHLKQNTFLVGEQMTIADLFAFAYVEQIEPLEIGLSDFPQVERWYDTLLKNESVQAGRKFIEQNITLH